MLFTEMDKILQPLRERVDTLEAKAGIEAQTERAREGSFMPLGIDGEKVSPDEYFADEADHTRRGIRRAYFGVADVQLRKELISALRNLEAKHSELLDTDLTEKANAVAAAKSAARSLPWGGGMGIALACAAAGHFFKGQTGLVMGAIAGLFLGMGYVWNSKGAAETALEEAQKEEVQVQRDRKIRKLHPETFSAEEERSAEEDHNFGAEDARWKVKSFLESAA